MINVRLNIKPITDIIDQKIEKLKDREYLLRPVAFDLIDLMTNRIHIKGQASDGSQIGTYSKGYLAVRSGVYGNSEKFSKGKSKGQIKNSGVYTKGKNKGSERPSYNRGTDPKIIVSLTRQLENDWSVIATDKGYGIGFKNKFNYQKARWVEARKKKKIFDLTATEREFALNRLNELAAAALK